MIIYEKRGKFRVTEEEEQQIFASPSTRDLVQKLQDIRKEKKREDLLTC